LKTIDPPPSACEPGLHLQESISRSLEVKVPQAMMDEFSAGLPEKVGTYPAQAHRWIIHAPGHQVMS